MRSFAIAMGLALLPACTLFVDDGHSCELGQPPGVAAIAPAQQRNPETLQCQSFGGPVCDPACGPCPAVDLAPQPSWGFCGSTCDQLDEASCAKQTGCRVVRDANCAVSGTCAQDYIGCFPTDQVTDITLACASATDGQTCSRSERCTALHKRLPCPGCTTEFAMCIPEGSNPGRCHDAVACDARAPECATGTTPGVVNGCWSGACIPNDICEPLPPGA